MELENGNLGISSIVALGSLINLKEKDISNLLFHSIMEMSKMGISMVKELNFSTMEIDMMECTRMENLKVKELMLGVTAPSIKDSLRMDFALVLGFGSMELKSMREPMSMTKEMEMEHIHGQEEAITKALLCRI